MEETMKCVSMFGTIQRLTDKQADYVVKRKEGEYVSKSEWKKQVRKIVEKVEEKIEKKKEKEIKKVAKLVNTDEATATQLVNSIENFKKEKKKKK